MSLWISDSNVSPLASELPNFVIDVYRQVDFISQVMHFAEYECVDTLKRNEIDRTCSTYGEKESTFTFLVEERKWKCLCNLYADKGYIEMNVKNYVMRID
jgi:hypothetical protein